MRTSLRRLLVASAALAAAASVTAPAASAAELAPRESSPPKQGSLSSADGVSASAISDDLIAVVGGDDALWVAPGNGGFIPFGGRLLETPTIVRGYTATYFVAVGGDRNIWVRTPQRNWAPMAPAGTRCSGASAVVSGNEIGVACRGDDGGYWFGRGPVPAGDALPTVGFFSPKGGFFREGTGVSVSDEGLGSTASFIYSGVGGDGRIYTSDDAAPGFRLLQNDAFCRGNYFASEFFEALVCGTSTQDGAVQVYAQDGFKYFSGGVTRGRPAVVVQEDGNGRIYAVGTDNRVYVADQPVSGGPGPFRLFGGIAKHGVTAVTSG